MDAKTPLYDQHLEAGGKMVSFAGYILPVQYTGGILSEHAAVRTGAGMFDVSHMGEFLLEGPGAEQALNRLLTNGFCGMRTGTARYSPMCYTHGGTVDDLIVYRQDDKYMIVVNAANRAKDFDWMSAHLGNGAKLFDVSDDTALLAVQGPQAKAAMQAVLTGGQLPERYYSFACDCSVAGISCLVSRTGYTGEDGFEIYAPPARAGVIWDALLGGGKDLGLIPCGLGARDTLRLEAGMPLYGHELSDSITPAEAGLGFFIKRDKPDFIGRDALSASRQRKRVGLALTDRGIAREGAKVFLDGGEIGFVTSGTLSPTLKRPIAMALVSASVDAPAVDVEVRGKMLRADVVRLPFYKRA
jgi:aminomethyltransferase